MSPRDFTARLAHSQSAGERLTREPRTGGFQPAVPSTIPPSLLWAPSPASSFVESGKKYLISVYSKCSFRPWNCPASCILPFCPPPSRFPRASQQGQRPVPPAAARVPITVRERRSSRKRRRSTGRRRCRHGGGRSSGPGSPSPRARAPVRGWAPPPWLAPFRPVRCLRLRVARDPRAASLAARGPGAAAQHAPFCVRFRSTGPARSHRPPAGDGRAQLRAPGGGRRRSGSREKFPEPCCSPPLLLLSGVCGPEAAPQRREPGAASAQRLRSLPPRQRRRGSADPFAVTHPPNRRPERNTVTCPPSGRHLHYPTFPEPNNTYLAPGEPLGLW